MREPKRRHFVRVGSCGDERAEHRRHTAEDRGQDGRHRHLQGDAIALDAAQDLVEIETGMKPDRRPGSRRGQ